MSLTTSITENPKNQISRIKSLDLIKGIAIIVVVLGHCIQMGSGAVFNDSTAYFENPVFKLIYSCHMPLFALVSGFLFYGSANKYNFTATIKKQLKGLLIPILSWSLGVFVIDTAIRFLGGQNRHIGISTAIDAVIHIITDLWYLWAILVCSVGVLVVKKFFKDSVFVYAGITIILLFVPDIAHTAFYIYMFPYFAGGYLWNKFFVSRGKSFKTSRIATIFAVSLAIWIVMLIGYGRDHYIYTTRTFILEGNVIYHIFIDLYRWIIGAAGSICVISSVLFVKNYSLWTVRFMCRLGKSSLAIYIISNYLNIYVLKALTSSFELNYIFTIIETVIMLLVCLILEKAIKLVPILNRMLLGGR